MADAPTILVFDSGLGGLTVHAEVARALPAARYLYLADDAAFPYGRLSAEACAARVIAVIGAALASFRPDLVVIACNTASTVALPGLRAVFEIPFVGTVPAVKPAAVLSQSRMISILGTPGTVNREYTHDLIIAHAADCRVTLVGAAGLASLAEAHLRGEPVSDDDVLAEIAPCFRERDGSRTDAVALACTHYPLLLDIYRRVAPWEVAWIDPAPAIARRVVQLLADRGEQARSRGSTAPFEDNLALFTSGAPRSQTVRVMNARGLALGEGLAMPFAGPAA
jgi:glutamate racemase